MKTPAEQWPGSRENQVREMQRDEEGGEPGPHSEGNMLTGQLSQLMGTSEHSQQEPVPGDLNSSIQSLAFERCLCQVTNVALHELGEDRASNSGSQLYRYIRIIWGT